MSLSFMYPRWDRTSSSLFKNEKMILIYLIRNIGFLNENIYIDEFLFVMYPEGDHAIRLLAERVIKCPDQLTFSRKYNFHLRFLNWYPLRK